MKTKRFALIICILILTLIPAAATVTGMKETTVTISRDEYEALMKYQRLEEILQAIDEGYLWEYDEEALIEGAAQGMLGALGDDYSYYYTPMEMEQEQESITGVYGGVGIEVFANPNDLTITIKRVFHGGPAQQGGIRASDKIIAVNGIEMSAYELSDAVALMRGEVGGEVTLTIRREEEVFDVTLVRALITTEIIQSDMLEDDIGYIRIFYFEGNLTQQFEDALDNLIASGAKGLVLDLRENPGGYVHLCMEVADLFLNDQVILSTEDKYGRVLSAYSEEGAVEIPVAILIDGYSASAAEILAAALHDGGVATLVGEKSFGKGIMQSVYEFGGDGAGMQLTTQYWLCPDGDNIHDVGIEPDILVELSEDAVDENFQFVRERDNQLQAAVRFLLTGEMPEPPEPEDIENGQ